MKKYNNIKQHEIIHNAELHLLECMHKDDFETSATWVLFKETVFTTTSKTQLLNQYIKSCNEELDRQYVRVDSIYGELKSLIKGL